MSLRIRILTAITALVILMLACGKLEIGVEPNNGNRIEVELKSLPPAEGGSENCPLSDFDVYLNGTYGYCFGYPNQFSLENVNESMPEVRGPAIGSEIEPVYATLRIEVDSIEEGQSLREKAKDFLQAFSVLDVETYSWNEIEVGGEPGFVIEPIPVQLSWKIIFVQHNNNLYRLMYWPVDVQEAEGDLDELYQVSTQTFEFIN